MTYFCIILFVLSTLVDKMLSEKRASELNLELVRDLRFYRPRAYDFILDFANIAISLMVIFSDAHQLAKILFLLIGLIALLAFAHDIKRLFWAR